MTLSQRYLGVEFAQIGVSHASTQSPDVFLIIFGFLEQQIEIVLHNFAGLPVLDFERESDFGIFRGLLPPYVIAVISFVQKL